MSPTAARDLRDIVRHPSLQRRYDSPSQLALDEVIAELADLGRVSFTRPDDWLTGVASAEYGCALRLRVLDSDPIIASGETSLIAGLRVLAAALDILDRESDEAVGDLQRMLSER